MSRTVTIEIFTYDELSPEAQKLAREAWSDAERQNGDEGVCDWINDHFDYNLKELGYPHDDIRWSLSYCQGDGMAFYGRVEVTSAMLDRWVGQTENAVLKAKADALKRLLEIEAVELTLDIEPNSYGSHYAHYNTMNVSIEVHFNEDVSNEDEEWITSWCASMEKVVGQDVRNLSGKLADEGYKLIDDYHEADHVAEILENNDYEFTKDGSIWSEHFEAQVTS